MWDKFDWKDFLKYAIPAAIAAGVGAKVVQRQRRIEEFNSKYIKPLQVQSQIWQDAIGQMQGALSDLDTYEEVYNTTKGGGIMSGSLKVMVDKIKKDDSKPKDDDLSSLVYKHAPEPDKAREMLQRAADTIVEAKPTLVLDKDDLIQRINDVNGELKTSTNYKGMQRKISEAVQDSKRVRSDYDYTISKMKKKRNTYVKLLS